ncbi:MAG: HAMP domain-containing sensor histidine kinase [Marinomonas sp.]
MASSEPYPSIRAMTDCDDRLLDADEPLAQLQMHCGGVVPGIVAVPELLEVVQQSRSKGVRIAREFHAFDGNETVSGFVSVSPLRGDGEDGCELLIEGWKQDSRAEIGAQELSNQLDMIDRLAADMTVRLDRDQRVLTASTDEPDLLACKEAMEAKPRTIWTDFVALIEEEYRQPLHWRLLDRALAKVGGSAREWRIRLMPLGGPRENPDGFELLLLADQPLNEIREQAAHSAGNTGMVGGMLSRVLRQPIGRIISNAETIRARLAGPLRTEYTNYAGDISSAGSHLLALLEDLADLEDVESNEFATRAETVDLTDVVQRASSILSGKSQAKRISVEIEAGENAKNSLGVAKAEFRRVLQILINVLGNAINYSPEGSIVTISVSGSSAKVDQVMVSVADQGGGLTAAQQARVFTKYERLGREGDGGTGLGLYISRRLARAMSGELSVESNPGEGAKFTLTLPAAD